ncbi:MAG TPA: PEP-CTERM sorting domain-containing protein [Accumulibacter sp.]|nr:PEP-CTERM sorting domain-containing protein [Accumulibacter sp.]HPP45887.1 PEP-CTERM sorting domain-containing protein [Accumulibacter sp.]
MKFSKLRASFIALAISLPFQAHADLFSLTIDGVDPAGPGGIFTGSASPLPGVFVGLGNCNSPGAPASGPDPQCNGLAERNLLDSAAAVDAWKVDHNSPTTTNAVIYGFNFPLDQILFHKITPLQFNNGDSKSVSQGFDFIVGYTGKYSSGPGGDHCGMAPPAGTTPQDAWLYNVALGRNVTITNNNTLASISAFIPQSARLCIGAIDTDWLSIDPSNVVNIDLTSIGGTSINFQLGGVGPLSQGDPNVPVILGANGLPLPSTLALMGVGLLGLARRLGVRKQPAVD